VEIAGSGTTPGGKQSGHSHEAGHREWNQSWAGLQQGTEVPGFLVDEEGPGQEAGPEGYKRQAEEGRFAHGPVLSFRIYREALQAGPGMYHGELPFLVDG
jgi:hypothetical protein